MFVPIGTEEATARRRFPAITVSLVVINSLVFLWELVLLLAGGEEALGLFIAASGVIPAAVTSDESLVIPFFLTPLTSIFVHRVSALVFIGIWFITQFFNGVAALGVATAETGGVAYWTHIGGFVAGLVAAWFYRKIPGQDRRVWSNESVVSASDRARTADLVRAGAGEKGLRGTW